LYILIFLCVFMSPPPKQSVNPCSRRAALRRGRMGNSSTAVDYLVRGAMWHDAWKPE
jgi:hypothetical protein